MIQHRADKSEITRLAIIGAGNLLHFREAGTPVTCEWHDGQRESLQSDAVDVATFRAHGVKDQPATWRGIAMLAKMGWRLDRPGLDWERMETAWILALGFPCPPWDADFLQLQAEPK